MKSSDILSSAELDNLCINTVRFLSVDAVEKADSGHPALPMGAAPMAYVLWTRFLKHNPNNPGWEDRDRFVLSAGHGSTLLYSLLHLTGYDLPLEQIQLFRQWGSKTPGHPERGVIYVFTHDSIALGQDGPTHQPIEQLASLRAMPELIVIRPCDANETAVAWGVAIETRDRPVALILTRQNVPTLDRTQFAAAEGLRRGAYVLEDAPEGKPDLILIGTGSEVSLIVRAGKKLTEEGMKVRIVSMPSWKLFDAQPQSYRDSVLPPAMHKRLAVEAGSTQGWCKYIGGGGDVIGADRFGASAPGEVVMREYGFTVENVCQRAMELVNGKWPVLHQRTDAEAVAVWRNEGDPN